MIASEAPQSVRQSPPMRSSGRAPAPPVPQTLARATRPASNPTLARCAGACSCGGGCAKPENAVEDELHEQVRESVMARATLQRDIADDLLGGGEQAVKDLCKTLNTSTGTPAACATNKNCPTGFCVPMSSKAQAIAVRTVVKQPLLAGIRTKVNPRVVPFWDAYMGSGFGLGGEAAVRDLSSGFGSEFTSSPTTARTSAFLTQALVKDLEANRPAVAPGTSITLDVPTRIPAAVAAITTPDDPNEMNFNIPSDLAGNLAGGIGSNEAVCPVGAHPSPQNDDRLATGTAKITGNADGSLTVEPDLTFEVHDTIDLCPGDCGSELEQCATIILSQLEATGVSGDIAFKVTFPASPQAPLQIAPSVVPVPPLPVPPLPVPPAPVPPKPPAPGPTTKLTCPRFLLADGTPEPTLQACFENRKRLAAGAHGTPVRMVQEALLALKFDLGPFGADGAFGGATAAAVRAFKKQQALGFETIGDVGPGTMGRLDSLCPA